MNGAMEALEALNSLNSKIMSDHRLYLDVEMQIVVWSVEIEHLVLRAIEYLVYHQETEFADLLTEQISVIIDNLTNVSEFLLLKVIRGYC